MVLTAYPRASRVRFLRSPREELVEVALASAVAVAVYGYVGQGIGKVCQQATALNWGNGVELMGIEPTIPPLQNNAVVVRAVWEVGGDHQDGRGLAMALKSAPDRPALDWKSVRWRRSSCS
jgi:hypothetical protein